MLSRAGWRCALALILIISLLGGTSLAQPGPKVEFIDVLIGFSGPAQPNILKGVGAEITAEFKYMPVVAARVPFAALEALSRNPAIAYIEPDAIATVSQTVPWGVDRIEAIRVHTEKGVTGAGAKVAVIDTGIDPNHRDLNVLGGATFTGSASWADDHGHGTHVAGTVAALDNTVDVIGVAPDAALYAVKVLDSQGSGQYSWIINGIEWSITNGMDVINMSLGGSSGSSALQTACQNAWDAGIVVVAAAGNSGKADGTGDNIGYPAKYSTVIAVGSIDSNNLRSSFSSTGPALEIMAPGRDIPSTKMGGGVVSYSGTSMASPHVAGVAALIRAAQPGWTNQQVRDQMNNTTTPIGDGDPYKYGNGLVNAYAAVPDTTPPDPTQIKLTLATDKSTYTFGETITITATVKDGANALLAGADVNVTVTVPAGQQFNFNGTSGSNGLAVFTMTAQDTYGAGQYAISGSASKSGYITGTASTTCNVISSQALAVTVWTDRSEYVLYDIALIYAKVVDSGGTPVGSANVAFKVVSAWGFVSTGSATTYSDGIASVMYFIWPWYGYGTYNVSATASKSGYQSGTGTTTFLVR